MFKMNKMKLAFLSVIAAGSFSAVAATNGALSPDESTASIEVAAEIVPMLQITGVNDVDFGRLIVGQNLVPDALFQEVESFCVFTNGSGYNLTFESANAELTSGSGSSFSMISSEDFVSDQLPYSIKLEVLVPTAADAEYSTIAELMDKDTTYGPFVYQSGYEYQDSECGTPDGNFDNVKLTFSLDSEDAFQVLPSTYNDTIFVIARSVNSTFGDSTELPTILPSI